MQKFKIAVGTNIFGECCRQSLGIESLLKCKDKFKDKIDLFNLQFENGRDLKEVDGFKTLKCLKRTSKNEINGDKHLPMVKEMFDSLAALGYDYFCFINSDIIVSYKFFDEIFSEEHNAYVGSRLAIEGDITDINLQITINDSNSPVRNSHYQVSGFDAFTIKTDWWNQNRKLFPDYVYAVVYWDTHYATIFLKNTKTRMQNKFPTLFHIIHEDKSSARIKEFFHNENIFYNLNREDFNRWHNYFFNILVKRPGINFVTPHFNELELQQMYFTT